MTKDTFILEINKLRKANKNKWYQFIGKVDNHDIQIKCFNTSIHIFRIDGMSAPSMYDLSVSEFNNKLIKFI